MYACIIIGSPHILSMSITPTGSSPVNPGSLPLILRSLLPDSFAVFMPSEVFPTLPGRTLWLLLPFPIASKLGIVGGTGGGLLALGGVFCLLLSAGGTAVATDPAGGAGCDFALGGTDDRLGAFRSALKANSTSAPPSGLLPTLRMPPNSACKEI